MLLELHFIMVVFNFFISKKYLIKEDLPVYGFPTTRKGILISERCIKYL